MAGGALAVTSAPTGNYNGKITSFVVVSCIIAALGGAIFGYDSGVSGGVTSMESFLKKFFPHVYSKMRGDTKTSNYCTFDSQLLTLFTSSLYLAGLIASLFASSMTRAFGRKPSLFLGGATVLVGSALGGAAVNIYMLILGRLLLGVGVGFANQAIPVYLVEMAPAKYRGAFNNGFTFSLSLGALLASFVNVGTEKIPGGWGWRVSLAVIAVPAFILTVGSLFLPETPNSVIERSSDHKVAERTLQKIRGTSDVQAELDDIIQASLISKTISHPFKNLISRPKYRPQLIMAILIPFFQQMTGVNVVGFYAPVLFRTVGFAETLSLLSTAWTSIVALVACLMSVLTVDKFGRRKLFFFGGLTMFFSLAIIGGIMAAKLGDHGMLSKGYANIVLVLICVYIVGYCTSWGPLGFLVPSEIFQLEIRSAAQGITVAVSFIFTALIAQTLLTILCHFKAGTFFFFAGWLVLMTTFVYSFLPETKNVPLEKMDQLWKQHWFWGSIVTEKHNANKDTVKSTAV